MTRVDTPRPISGNRVGLAVRRNARPLGHLSLDDDVQGRHDRGETLGDTFRHVPLDGVGASDHAVEDDCQIRQDLGAECVVGIGRLDERPDQILGGCLTGIRTEIGPLFRTFDLFQIEVLHG